MLDKMATESNRPLARLHALCTLDGLGTELDQAVWVRMLKDPHPGVRRQAVRMCERIEAPGKDLLLALEDLENDSDPHVRLQLAYTRGMSQGSGAGSSLGRLALRSAGDPYVLAAILSSVREDQSLAGMLAAVLTEAKKTMTPPPEQLLKELFRLGNSIGSHVTLGVLIALLEKPENGKFAPWQFRTLTAGLDAAADKPEGKLATLWMIHRKDLAPIFVAAREVAVDPKASAEDRASAIHLLGRGSDHQAEDAKVLTGFLSPQTAPELQTAAVSTLGRISEGSVPKLLLEGWKGYGPGLRSQILDVLLRREQWVKQLLDAIESKQILAIEIDAGRRQRLLQQKNAALRERAAKLFAGTINTDRQKVLDSYRSVLTAKGDPKRGAQIFTKTCATCHRFQGVGEEVGPDLASLGDKSPEALLTAILDPNRAVEARYIAYIAVTKSGVSYNGLLASETGNSVTIVSQDGKKHTILRTELEALSSTDKSAMPEGLEKDLKPQDVADVIAHLRVGVPAPVRREFEGNKPELVRPDKDGVIKLSSRTCELYGTSICFEPLRLNLGYWESEDDRAIWTVDVPKAGKYTVSLDYSCPDDSAGNKFALITDSGRLTGIVTGTGGWQKYKEAKFGEIDLAAGKQQVTMRSEGKIRQHLLDLRAVRLVPIAAK
jgi:putative heme-binding domain-containing protein